MKAFLARTAKQVLYVAYVVLSSTFLLFTLLEWVPALTDHLNLQAIRYYAQRQEYKPDPTLVFLPMRAGAAGGTSLETTFVGDMSSPAYGSLPAPVPYRATYTPDGFRSNSSMPPFDVLMLGDSYLEFGETDSLTFSEQLKQTSGFTVFNLGRGWYGPFQYLELFKQYGPMVKPRFGVFCFFDGNDAEDTKQYLRWLNGKSYYTFVWSTKSYAGRYFTALRDSYKWLFKQVDRLSETMFRERNGTIVVPEKIDTGRTPPQESTEAHPDLGIIDLHGSPTRMRFNYWNRPMSTRELLETEEWQALGRILQEYKCIAARHGIVPVVVFIPNKIEVYGAHSTDQSGSRFLAKMGQQRQFEDSSHDAFVALAEDSALPVVDLIPAFRSAAADGRLLYYPFDTHWNPEGRQLAAHILAESLTRLEASPPVATCAL
jgi:hypothetical protein